MVNGAASMFDETRSRYDQLVVENPQRSTAIGEFVAKLVGEEVTFPGIVFVRKVRHAEVLAESISQALSRRVPIVTSLVSREERRRLARRMRAEDPAVPVVVATAAWSTGIDIPSLRWVLMAGAGQAPIGLKQGSGRALRPHEEKTHYVIYDWQDEGPGTEQLQEQGQRRLKHYTAGGFSVEKLRVPAANPEGDPDAERLLRLLEQASDGTRPQSTQRPLAGLPLLPSPSVRPWPSNWQVFWPLIRILLIIGAIFAFAGMTALLREPCKEGCSAVPSQFSRLGQHQP